MNLLPQQQMVVEDLRDLNTKLTLLCRFLETSRYGNLPKAEKDRLQTQRLFMAGYGEILRQRIEAFTS